MGSSIERFNHHIRTLQPPYIKKDKKQQEDLEKQVRDLKKRIKELEREAEVNIIDWKEFFRNSIGVTVGFLLKQFGKGSFEIRKDIILDYCLVIKNDKDEEVFQETWNDLAWSTLSKLIGKRFFFDYTKNGNLFIKKIETI